VGVGGQGLLLASDLLSEVIDLDSLADDRREAILNQLRTVPSARPVRLISYRVNEHDEARLRANGVAVFRGLSREVFKV
jgi:hypothetical protein